MSAKYLLDDLVLQYILERKLYIEPILQNSATGPASVKDSGLKMSKDINSKSIEIADIDK